LLTMNAECGTDGIDHSGEWIHDELSARS